MKNLQSNLLKALGNHNNVIVDFGDGIYEKLYFDESIGKYRGEDIAIWEMKLLVEIAKGEVENTRLMEELK